MEEHNQNNEHGEHGRHVENSGHSYDKKVCLLKYLGIVIACFIASFLAFYLVADLTFKSMFSPHHQMKKFEKMMAHDTRMLKTSAKGLVTDVEEDMMMHSKAPKMHNIIHLMKTDDAYKIVVNLKHYNIKPENVKVNINEGILNITGEGEKKKLAGEQVVAFSQSYYLGEDIAADKMTKEKMKDKLVVIVPFD